MPRLLSEVTTDFSAGQVDSAAPTAMPRTALLLALNARINPDNTAQRRSGTIRTHAAALNAATGYGAAHFVTAAGVDQIVAIFGANAYKSEDNGATWAAAIATGLRQDYYTFATMRVGASNYLFAANGDTTIKRWDGTTWDTLPNAPASVKFIAVFNGRLYAAGHNGIIVQASEIADPTTWTSPDGLTVQVSNHSGQALAGLFQIGPHLLVYDETATSYIDGYGEQSIVVATGATGFSRSVGCAAFRTIVAVGDNAVCWLSRRGVEYYSPGGGVELLSKSVQSFLGEIDWEELYANPGRASAAYDEINQDYYLALSTDGVRNNRVLVLNLRSGQVQYQRQGPRAAATVDRFLSPAADILFGSDADGYLEADVAGGVEVKSDPEGYFTLAALGVGGEAISEDADGYLTSSTNDTLPATLFAAPSALSASAIYSLGYDGFVRRHENVAADDMLSGGTGGTAVEMTLRSRPFLFGAPRHRKRARVIHVTSAQESAATLTVLTRGEGTSTAQSVSVPATATGEAHRARAMTKLDTDAVVVEVRTTADVKVSLIGLSAEILRERSG